MSEKKVIGRNVAIALGIACIILVAGIGGAVVYYTMQVNNKDSTYNDYVSTHSHTNDEYKSLQDQINQLQTWLDGNKTLLAQTQAWLSGNISAYISLQSTYTSYVNDHHHTDEDYTNLQDQIASLQGQIVNLEGPTLVEVNLKSDDNHPFLDGEYLHVYGYICNVGNNTAYNCKLHVVGYQSGGVVAFDTYIILGTIYGYSWTSVDGSITYSGSSLTNWAITPQWTSS
jgi:hypothetical protein